MTITQQTFTVSGVVTDTNGEPIIGANVIEKGTTNGAVTDFDGKFSLSLQNKQSILVVTYIGYNTKEIPAGNGSPLTIQLQDDTQNLDEVIVVGYSVQKKKRPYRCCFRTGGRRSERYPGIQCRSNDAR